MTAACKKMLPGNLTEVIDKKANRATEVSVLLIAKAFPPENVSGAARPYRFFKYLPDHGYRPSVIAAGSEPDRLDGVFRSPGSSPGRPARCASSVAATVQRLALPYDDSWPWAPFAIADSIRLVRQSSSAIVFSTSPPLANHIAAMALKLASGLRWVADFRDPLLGNPFRRRKAAHYYDAALERLIFRNADAVIANTDSLAEMWRARYPRWRHKVRVIWNGYDPDDRFGPEPIANPARRTLAHVGSIYEDRNPGPLLEALERLIGRNLVDGNRILFRLVGHLDTARVGGENSAFRRLAELGCLEYNGSTLPASEARQIMASVDSLVLLDMNGVGEKLQVPAKLFDYVRTGRPVLAFTTAGSPSEGILSRSGVRHKCIDPGAPSEQIETGLLEFLQMPTSPVPMSDWFTDTFDARRQTRALADIFDIVLRKD